MNQNQTNSSYIKGKQGESIVQNYLIQNGWNIICTNYRTKYGEIDIVALDGKELVFIEVKSGNYQYFELAEKISIQKRKHIELCAIQFQQQKKFQSYSLRFDIVIVSMPNQKIHHFRHEFF